MENKKTPWLTWLALLFAVAALLVSFIFIGQAKDTSGEFEAVVEAYNATVAQLNEVIEDYNQVAGNFSRIVEEYNLVVEDYWEWRAEQDAAGGEK